MAIDGSRPGVSTVPTGDFTVLPMAVRVPGTTLQQLARHRTSSTDDASPNLLVRHRVFLRPARPSEPDHHRRLFAAGLPADADEPAVRALIAAALGGVPGRVEAVHFLFGGARRRHGQEEEKDVPGAANGKKRKRGDTAAADSVDDDAAGGRGAVAPAGSALRSTLAAVIVLVDGRAAAQVLKAAAKLHRWTQKHTAAAEDGNDNKLPVWRDGAQAHAATSASSSHASRSPPLGDTSWLSTELRSAYPPAASLQAGVDAWLAAFDARAAAAAAAARRARSEPDADGFVTVTRTAAAARGLRATASMAAAKEHADRLRDRQEKKQEGMADFYRWQLRERKKTQREGMVRRFEADRRKVREMRARRQGARPEG